MFNLQYTRKFKLFRQSNQVFENEKLNHEILFSGMKKNNNNSKKDRTPTRQTFSTHSWAQQQRS